jgi:hypothetical protein
MGNMVMNSQRQKIILLILQGTIEGKINVEENYLT